MVSKTFFAAALFFVSGYSQASVIITPRNADSVQKFPYFSLPLFNESEQKFLISQNRKNIARSRIYPNLNKLEEASLIKLILQHYSNDFLVEQSGEARVQEDPLLDRQWALHNRGEPQRIAIDHYTSGFVDGVAGQDIGLLNSPNESREKNVIVAIIDTGVDHKHPDLKGSLASKGYNVLTQNDDTQDAHGHGTHLSGIIAAQANNIGIKGVSTHLKILPIKVIQAGPNAPIRPQGLESSGTALTENVAKGILYAIQNGAQVVNMSLAWPASIRSNLVESMVKLAEEKNILLVASAGNDSSNAPVFPCAYPTVVCVAAHGPDGAYSHFSNYGSMVDITAPGTAIISTWPMNKSPTTFAGGIGYEYRNGTSMAAPFIAAALGDLIASGISPKEARARVLLGTTPTSAKSLFLTNTTQNFSTPAQQSNKWARFGNLNISQAFKVSPQPLIIPVKNVEPIIWDGIQASVPVKISIKNEWQRAKAVTAKINESEYYLEKLDSAETATLTYLLNLNENTESLIHLRLTVLNKEFKIPVSIVREFTTRQIPKGSIVTHIAGLKINSDSELRSIVTADTQASPSFVLIENSQDSFHATIIEDHVLREKISISSRSNDQLLNVYKTHGGSFVFVFTNQSESITRPSFFLHYFDKKLNPIKQVTAGTETTILSEKFQWMRLDSEDTPAWVSIGFTPKPDLPAYDPWNPGAKDVKMARFYFIQDNQIRSLKLKETQLPIDMLPKTESDSVSGSVRVLIAEGESYSMEYKILTINNGTIQKTETLNLPNYRMLIGTKNVLPIQSLSKLNTTGQFAVSGASAQGGLRISGYLGGVTFDEQLTRSSPLESLIVTSGVYADTANSYFFVQTHYDLKFYRQGSDRVQSTSLNRYSYIPSMISNRSFFPTVLRNQKEHLDPAIYLPASILTDYASEIIYADIINDGAIKRPARLKMRNADPSCTSLGNLVAATDSNPAYLVYFCDDQQILVPIQ